MGGEVMRKVENQGVEKIITLALKSLEIMTTVKLG